MKANWTLLLPMVTLAFACGPTQDDLSLETDASEASSDLIQSTLDVSELIERDYRAEPLAATAEHAGCVGQREILETATACDRTYPSLARVTWSCEAGPRGVSGTAEIQTTITPDACPPTTLEFDQEIDWARERHFDGRGSSVDGWSRLHYLADRDAHAAEKSIEVDVRRRRYQGEEIRGDRHITGDKTVRLERGEDPADDSRTVNGQLRIDFLLRDARLDLVKDELRFERSCCYPVSGTITFTRTRGEESRERSVTFGPTCGEATTGNGDSLDLRPCPNVND